MKKSIIFFILLIPNLSYSTDAVITVLEAPLFKEKSIESKIVQYYRKGDVIKLHPSVSRIRKYDHLSPGYEKIQTIKKELSLEPERKDPMFDSIRVEESSPYDVFVPTLDRQGQTAYILTEHIKIYFNDEREFSLDYYTHDKTDYRLKEPLPENYPLVSTSEYRGGFTFGFSQPYNDSYPYTSNVTFKGYTSPKEFFATYLKKMSDSPKDRFYVGGAFRFRIFENEFGFGNERTSQELYYQIGIGPMITFDTFNTIKHRVNLYSTIIINPLNYLKVTQSQGGISESKTFYGVGLTTRIGAYYQKKAFIDKLDLVLGSCFDFEPSIAFKSYEYVKQPTWWRERNGEKFSTRHYTAFTFSIGVQASY